MKLGVLLRLELLRLLRAREVTHFLILPALLFVPIILAIAIGVITLRDSRQSVALPRDTPPELALEATLELYSLRVVWSDDPEGAFRRGEVAASVLYWQLGSAAPYWVSAVALLVPIAMTWRLPRPEPIA